MKKPVRLVNPFASIEPEEASPRRRRSGSPEGLRRAIRALRLGLLQTDPDVDELVQGFVTTATAGPLVRSSVPHRDAALDAAVQRGFAAPIRREGWLRLERERLVHGLYGADGWDGAALYFDDIDLGVLTRWKVDRDGQPTGVAHLARFRARVISFPSPRDSSGAAGVRP
jgi:hypothetical protein